MSSCLVHTCTQRISAAPQGSSSACVYLYMIMKRKICVVTGTRAEYGLLRWVIDGIENSSFLELQLIVTGMHLSPEFGLTIKEIENCGEKV